MIEDAVLKVWEESLVALALKLNVLFPLIKKFGFALIYILFDIFTAGCVLSPLAP